MRATHLNIYSRLQMSVYRAKPLSYDQVWLELSILLFYIIYILYQNQALGSYWEIISQRSWQNGEKKTNG